MGMIQKTKKFSDFGTMTSVTQWHTISNLMSQTIPERRSGSSERSVANSPTMSARHIELQWRHHDGISTKRWKSSDKYGGVRSCSDWNIVVASLYWMHSEERSHWRLASVSVLWSERHKPDQSGCSICHQLQTTELVCRDADQRDAAIVKPA